MSTNEISSADSSKPDTTNEIDQQRFSQGVLFRGKFFGVEEVKKETGDDVCNDSMIKLKAVLAAKKESKQRICIKINLEGIEIMDEKTSTTIYKHSVNKISYIARDIKDSRAIGYIYKNSDNNFQYFGLRTIDQAQTVFNTLKDLFEVVLKMRKEKKKDEDNTTSTTTTTPTPNEIVKPEPEKESLVDSSNDKTSLINANETKQLVPSSFDTATTTTTPLAVPEIKTEPPKAADPFGLLDLSTGSQSTPPTGLNPLVSLSLNDSLFSSISPTNTMNPMMPPQRPSPAMPYPMMMSPMVGSLFMQQQQQQQFQNPNPFQGGFANNPAMNPFGGNQFQQPPRPPVNTPMQSPVQNNQFSDLFSNSQFQQTANKQQQPQQANKPFQW